MIGRPDLTGLAQAGPASVLAAWFQPGVFLAPPRSLALATRPDGAPDLRLELARPVEAMSGPPARGTLDLGLAAVCPLDAALELARAADPTSTVRPAGTEGGWLWLLPGEAVAGAAPEPIALAGLGVTSRRWTLPLDADTAVRVGELLEHDVLLLSARAHLHLVGIAPRLPVKVRFTPAAAREALAAQAADGVAWVSRTKLLDALRADPQLLGFELLGDAEPDPLATALVDLVAAELASPVAGTPDAGPALLALAAGSVAGEPVERDLRQPFLTTRAIVLGLDPLTAVRDYVQAHGAGVLVVDTRLPTLQTGVHAVEVIGNLPAPREGVLAVGASLSAPPVPPTRPVAVRRDVELTPPEDRAQTTLALGPTEPLAYTVTATAVVGAGGAVRRLEGPPRARTSGSVLIGPGDLPVRFVQLAAGASLLACARVDVALGQRSVALSPQRPAVALAVLPEDEADGALTVRVRPLSTDEPVLELAPAPLQDLHVELTSLPGYGPHAVEITAAGECAVELAPESAAETAPAALVHLSSDRPRATWTYFADSPFAAGYRFRRLGETAWSPARPAGEPLDLTAATAARAWTAFEDLRHAATDDGSRVEYLPTAPSPQRDAAGRPAVSLLVAGDSAFLQLAAQWDPPAASIERLRAHLQAGGHGAVALAPPAGLVVPEAVLVVDGEPLQRVRTSGFAPWTALFAVACDAATRSAASAALHGEPGRLLVRFEGELDGSSMPMEADVAAWFTEGGVGAQASVTAADGIAGLRRFDTDPEGAPSAQDR